MTLCCAIIVHLLLSLLPSPSMLMYIQEKIYAHKYIDRSTHLQIRYFIYYVLHCAVCTLCLYSEFTIWYFAVYFSIAIKHSHRHKSKTTTVCMCGRKCVSVDMTYVCDAPSRESNRFCALSSSSMYDMSKFPLCAPLRVHACGMYCV